MTTTKKKDKKWKYDVSGNTIFWNMNILYDHILYLDFTSNYITL